MRFYFLNEETFQIEFTEPTNKELNSVKKYTRWTNDKFGVLLQKESERKIELHWTLESDEELLERNYNLFELNYEKI